MKKLFYSIIIAGLALTSVACQKIEEQSPNVEPAPTQTLTVTATIADIDGTKVSYGFTDNDAKKAIKQTWEEGDEIIARLLRNDEFQENYTFRVNAVKDGVASFSVEGYEPEAGDILYAVYYPGKTAEEISSENTISFVNQTGKLDKDAPAILCAGAEVIENGGNYSVKFDFENQTAIVGIYKMQILDDDTPVVSNTKITKVILKNVPTSGQFKYDQNNTCKFLAADDGVLGDIICDNLELYTDDEGCIKVNPEKPETFIPYFSVIPGNSEISVSVSDDNGNIYRNQTVIPAKSLAAGTYYYLGKIMSTTVAKIGESSYSSLTDAINAVSGSEPTEIDLASETEENCTIPIDRNITLNLAGRTIKGCITVHGALTVKDENNTGKIVNDKTCLKVMAGSNVTINGGIVEANSSDNTDGATVVINKDGKENQIESTTVTFNGGKISQIGSSTRGAIDAKYSTIAFPKTSLTEVTSKSRTFVSGLGVNLTINDGSFKSDKSYTIFLNNGLKGSTSINGGNFDGGTYCFQIYGGTTEVGITGGNFNWKERSDFLSLDEGAKGSQLTIKGGFFKKDVGTYVPSGYICTENTDETYNYKVVESQDLFEVGGIHYTNLDNALQAVKESPKDITIKVLQNMRLSSVIEFENTNIKITLDLNGKRVCAPAFPSPKTKDTVALSLNKNVNVTICDNTVDKLGSLVQDETDGTTYVIALNNGKLNINSGTIAHEGGTGYGKIAICERGRSGACELNVNGGHIYGGRALMLGSGNSSRVTTANIYGGWIQGLNGDNNVNNKYSVIGFMNSRGDLNIKGNPIIQGNTKQVIHCGWNYCEIKIEKDGDKIPFLYTDGSTILSSGDSQKEFFTSLDCYTNKDVVSHNEIISKSGATFHTLTSDAIDSRGNKYKYHLYKDE